MTLTCWQIGNRKGRGLNRKPMELMSNVQFFLAARKSCITAQAQKEQKRSCSLQFYPVCDGSDDKTRIQLRSQSEASPRGSGLWLQGLRDNPCCHSDAKMLLCLSLKWKATAAPPTEGFKFSSKLLIWIKFLTPSSFTSFVSTLVLPPASLYFQLL